MSAPPAASGAPAGESLPDKEARLRGELEVLRRTLGAEAEKTLVCMGYVEFISSILTEAIRAEGKGPAGYLARYLII